MDQPSNLFERIQAFEWDETKRKLNFLKHGIDFWDVQRILESDLIVGRSDRQGEIRYEIFGLLDGEVIAAVCTIRKDRCRWISARRASRNERKKYHRRVATRSAEGQD
jgi:hypothetical protein